MRPVSCVDTELPGAAFKVAPFECAVRDWRAVPRALQKAYTRRKAVLFRFCGTAGGALDLYGVEDLLEKVSLSEAVPAQPNRMDACVGALYFEADASELQMLEEAVAEGNGPSDGSSSELSHEDETATAASSLSRKRPPGEGSGAVPDKGKARLKKG
jgi:hypothetical protein